MPVTTENLTGFAQNTKPRFNCVMTNIFCLRGSFSGSLGLFSRLICFTTWKLSNGQEVAEVSTYCGQGAILSASSLSTSCYLKACCRAGGHKKGKEVLLDLRLALFSLLALSTCGGCQPVDMDPDAQPTLFKHESVQEPIIWWVYELCRAEF